VHIDKDLVAASATPLALAILAEGESYGYAGPAAGAMVYVRARPPSRLAIRNERREP
jgi:hypothetical protein